MLLFDQTVELIMWIFNYTLSFEQPVSNYWFKPPYVFDSLKRTDPFKSFVWESVFTVRFWITKKEPTH